MAFAAAGWCFGREVSRQAVDTLKAETDKAQDAAATAQAAEKSGADELDRARSSAAAFAGMVKVAFPAPMDRESFNESGTSPYGEIMGRADSILAEYTDR